MKFMDSHLGSNFNGTGYGSDIFLFLFFLSHLLATFITLILKFMPVEGEQEKVYGNDK